jgi:hypothetical protein
MAVTALDSRTALIVIDLQTATAWFATAHPVRDVVRNALLCGLLVGHTPVKEARIERPHWVIIATIIDVRTGEPLDQGKLEGRELEFDDPVECQAVVDRIRPIATVRVTAVLACLRVGPAEESL